MVNKLIRISFLFLLVIFYLFMTACSSSKQNEIDLDHYEVENTSRQVSEDDFIFRLVSEKEAYKIGEKVNLYGEIIYVGEKDEVEIVHSSSAILFNIYEMARNYEIGDIVNDIGITTKLQRNVPYRESYEKNVGYDMDAAKEYVTFIESFIEEDGFPSGYYQVNGFTDFAVFENPKNESARRYNMEASIDFKVTD